MAKIDINSDEFRAAVLRIVGEQGVSSTPALAVGDIVRVDHTYYNADFKHVGRFGIVVAVDHSTPRTGGPWYRVNLGTPDATEVLVPRATKAKVTV